MKIAIINLEDDTQLHYINEAINILIKDIIDPQVDLFIQKEYSNFFDNKDIKYTVNPIDMKSLNIFDMKMRYDNLRFYAKNGYDIAIDTQGTPKSSFITYILAGRTAGYKLTGFSGWCSSLFYDESIKISDLNTQEEKIKRLLTKPLGIKI